jgi:hypothetical protein
VLGGDQAFFFLAAATVLRRVKVAAGRARPGMGQGFRSEGCRSFRMAQFAFRIVRSGVPQRSKNPPSEKTRFRIVGNASKSLISLNRESCLI